MMQEECDSKIFSQYESLNPQISSCSLLSSLQVKVVSFATNDCPQIKNHSVILYNNSLYIFGGYDGKKNHSQLHVYNIEKWEWIRPQVTGVEPEGRNGHSACLIGNKMYIIGGWLGSGTFASSDVFSLNLDKLNWTFISTTGESPGPCNMHSADLIGRNIFVFRGGDGRDYLNDLHTLSVDNHVWRLVKTEGENPPPRANHSSAVLKNKLCIFGGWDGSKRLNDLYYLDTDTLVWTEIKVKSSSPSPRAGMSLCEINSKLYLFGGSGPSATCFNDLQIFDPKKNIWMQTNISEEPTIKARAGHSMTVVNDKLFIIGGSYGQQYYKDFYIIDTDPAPEIKNLSDNPQTRLRNSLRDYCNNKEFSDVTFIVEGRPFFGHKVILSLLCERFKVMFGSGMKESSENVIKIGHISYPVFAAVCQYLYTGEVFFGAETEGQELSLEYLLEFLAVSDEFMLDEIKVECEKHLINLLSEDSFQKIFDWAQKCNAIQLQRYCCWYQKKNFTEPVSTRTKLSKFVNNPNEY